MILKRLPLISKLKKPSPKQSRRLVTLLLAGAYTIICGIIIIPQIDHQSWFPSQLRSTDLPASIDFTKHREMIISLEDSTYTDSEIRESIQLMTKRASIANIAEFQVNLSESELVLSFPSDVSDLTINYITSPGTLEFSTPKIEVDFESNPIEMFNQDNFDASKLDISQITSAVIANQNEQYTYIELRTTPETKPDWEALAQSSPQGNIGFSIDGVMNPAWMLAPDGTNITEINLVIQSQSPEADIILSYLNDGPLPAEFIDTQPTEVDGSYSSDTLNNLYLLIVGVGLLSSILRNIIHREPIPDTIANMLIIIGSAAVLKFTGVPVSLTLLTALASCISVVLLTPRSSQLLLFICFVLLSIILRAFGSTDLLVVGRLFTVVGIYGIISIFFYEFTNIYEEK